MATNKQLKFYKVQTLPATLVVGAIYFEVSTQRICVAKSTTECDFFGVGLKGAALANGVLTITRFDNSTVTVDLNDIASATSVQNALNTINDKINVINGDSDGSIKKAVADEAALREAADAEIRKDFAAADTAAAEAAAEVYAAIRGEFAAADAALQANIDKKADAATTYSKTEVDGLVNVKANANDVYTKGETDTAIKVVSDALAQEVTDRGEAVHGLQGQIDKLVAGTVEVEHAEGDKYVEVSKAEGSTKYTVSTKGIDDAISAAVSEEKSEREVAEAGLQGAIDVEKGRISVLVGDVEGDDSKSVRSIAAEETAKIVADAPEAYDTLQEIAAWIASHPDSVATLNAAIEKNTQAITAETEAREAADATHTQGIADLVAADAAQDELIAKKADQTALDETNGKVSALEGLVGSASVDAQIAAKIEALKLDDTYVNESDYTTDKQTFEQKHADLQGEIDAAEGDIKTLQAAIERLDGEQDTQDQAIEAAAALGQQGIDDAAAALAEAKAKVASVTAGDHISVGTDAKNPVISVNVVGEIKENNTGLVSGGAIFNELCWVEF